MKAVHLLMIGAAVGGWLMYDKHIKTPRGIRNHNPGNIERTGTEWQGMRPIQTDKRFLQFESPEYGVRAMARILASYEGRGVNTVQGIIHTWAPPHENDTGSYVASVANKLGVLASQPIYRQQWPTLIAAIIQHENGRQPYPAEVIAAGVAMA
ncbi:structural protein [Endozoicomonas arenosclerae]|uniref:structural protein n=1 Tax=Endozoicomonas arenosclerae TaxID=1633495 RepID=UPI000A9EEA5A|nr:structural protein [Endozoicomonas arenosclerae]